jgi:hypothetical protein
MMSLFVRVTAVVAVAIVALIVLFFILKIVLIAALIAGLVVAGMWLSAVLRRRRTGVRTLTVRRF